MANKYKIITRTYAGNEHRALALYQKDATRLAAEGYFPISQIYTSGKWSTGDFILALLLTFIIIGILVFLYMIIVKPSGTLTVTYELREAQKSLSEMRRDGYASRFGVPFLRIRISVSASPSLKEPR